MFPCLQDVVNASVNTEELFALHLIELAISFRRSRVPDEGKEGQLRLQVSKIWAKPEFFRQRYKIFGQNQEFLSSIDNQLQKKVTKFR